MSQPVAYEPSRETAAAPDRIGAVGVTLFAVLAALFIWRGEPYGRSLAMLGMMMLAVTVHLTGYALAGSLFGIRPWQFCLFQGGALLRFQVRECWVAIGWLPLGGYVRFAGDEPDSATGWGGLHPLQRAFIALAGSLLLLLAAIASLGIDGTWAAIVATPGHIVSFARDGRAIASLAALVDGGHGAFGQLAVKLALLNLLPFGALAGERILTELVLWLTGRRVQFPRATWPLGLLLFVAFWVREVTSY